ncbi:hypothetical protein BDR22DRAFT_894476 [Usnea florida]
MPIDGKALYQMPQAQWIEEYGAQGHAIYMFQRLDTGLVTSAAYHAQTDGQHEKTNQRYLPLPAESYTGSDGTGKSFDPQGVEHHGEALAVHRITSRAACLKLNFELEPTDGNEDSSNSPFEPGSVRCQEVDDKTPSASSAVESSENDPEDRYPPIIADPDRRHYVATSATPWIMTNFDRRGYAFSDILYAATMTVDLNSADDIQRYPVIRSIRNPLRDLTVETKALDHNGMIGNEKKDTANTARTLYRPWFRHIQRLAQDTIQCLKCRSRYPFRAQARLFNLFAPIFALFRFFSTVFTTVGVTKEDIAAFRCQFRKNFERIGAAGGGHQDKSKHELLQRVWRYDIIFETFQMHGEEGYETQIFDLQSKPSTRRDIGDGNLCINEPQEAREAREAAEASEAAEAAGSSTQKPSLFGNGGSTPKQDLQKRITSKTNDASNPSQKIRMKGSRNDSGNVQKQSTVEATNPNVRTRGSEKRKREEVGSGGEDRKRKS